VQHALRAYTPRDQKAVKAAAATFRANPAFDTERAITELGKGEALVSVLDLKGVPTTVERTLIRPPSSRMGPITPEERRTLIEASPVFGQYDAVEDRESAYELLLEKAEKMAALKAEVARQKQEAAEARQAGRASSRETPTDRFVKTIASTVGRQVGSTLARTISQALQRGILGGWSAKR
jgi:DNA helicase HerA-like ATPase